MNLVDALDDIVAFYLDWRNSVAVTAAGVWAIEDEVIRHVLNGNAEVAARLLCPVGIKFEAVLADKPEAWRPGNIEACCADYGIHIALLAVHCAEPSLGDAIDPAAIVQPTPHAVAS